MCSVDTVTATQLGIESGKIYEIKLFHAERHTPCDGKVERGREACDDAINITTYNTGGKPGCAPGCKWSAYCGDKQIDSLAGKECDDGRDTGAYGGCTADCHLAARCGDAQLQSDAGEECDDGNLLNGDGCGADCTIERPR